MDKRSSRDFLSYLPLGIIHKILALVSIRDAVQTSNLSRKWRYKWASLPELVFDDKCVSIVQDDVCDSDLDYDMYYDCYYNDEHAHRGVRIKRFIQQALVLHEGPLQKFKLNVKTLKSCSYTDQWLVLLSRKDIRTLILHFDGYQYPPFAVHSSLFKCRKLTHLEVLWCTIPLPPPTFKGFSCLRCLVMKEVTMHHASVESLVANSSLLEELTLDYIKFCKNVSHYRLTIHAPNLKCFFFRGMCSDICLYAPLLAKLSVTLDEMTDEHLQQISPVCNYSKFFGGLSNLEELIVDTHFMEYLSIGIESCQSPLVFPHLHFMKFSSLSLDDEKVKSVFAHLITGAPNLYKLSFLRPCCGDCGPIFTFENVKVIEMDWIVGGVHEMRFIKLLLESLPMLETMLLKPAAYLYDAQLVKIMTELLGFRRVSANAKIVFSEN